MQITNYALKISSILLFSATALFFSCEGTHETSESTSDQSEVTIKEDANYELVAIDTNEILAWNALRKNMDEVQNCFNNLTNHFSIIRPSADIDSIYVYIGYDKNTQNITLYPIASAADTVGNLQSMPTSDIVIGRKVNLPVTVATDTTRADAIPLDIAKARIDNWKSNQIRNEWLQNVGANNDGEYLGLIYIIHTVDMVPGDLHDCYLALKEDPSAIGSYTGDLIIVNTAKNQIVQPEAKLTATTKGVIEDVVKLGPPFKGVSINNFGLLKQLNIK